MTLLHDPFYIRLLLSFLVGGVWILLATVIAERHGSQIGGVIGGMPSTMVVSYFFIGLTQSMDFASAATTTFPIMICFTAFFLMIASLVLSRGYWVAVLSGITVWAAAALMVIIFRINNFLLSLSLWTVTFIFFNFFFKKYLNDTHQKIEMVYTPLQVVGRAIFAGSMVAFVLIISRIAGPLAGGVFATFPVLYLSTFTIAYHTHGVKFTQALARPLILSALPNCLLYALSVRYLYPAFGLYLGTVGALLISLIAGYATYLILGRTPSGVTATA